MQSLDRDVTVRRLDRILKSLDRPRTICLFDALRPLGSEHESKKKKKKKPFRFNPDAMEYTPSESALAPALSVAQEEWKACYRDVEQSMQATVASVQKDTLGETQALTGPWFRLSSVGTWMITAKRPTTRAPPEPETPPARSVDNLTQAILGQDFSTIPKILDEAPYLLKDWDKISAIVLQNMKNELEASWRMVRPQVSRRVKVFETLIQCVRARARARLGILQNVWIQLHMG